MNEDAINASRKIGAAVPEGTWACPEYSDPSVWINISEDRPGICAGKRKLFEIDPYDFEDHVESDDDDDTEILAEDAARAVAVFCAHARQALPAALDNWEHILGRFAVEGEREREHAALFAKEPTR